MAIDNTQRFSDKVEDYVAYRPKYADGLFDDLQRQVPALQQQEAVIVDVGSGTGILTRQLLEHFPQAKLTAVEPNKPMAAAAESDLAKYIDSGRLRSVCAPAESTSLADHSADLIVAGTAFHWFDASLTKKEFKRILKPDGQVGIVYNVRVGSKAILHFHKDSTPVMDVYDSCIDKYMNVPNRYRDSQGAAERYSELCAFYDAKDFDDENVTWTVHHRSDFMTKEALIGRFLSASYAPAPGGPQYQAIVHELTAAFDENQVDGKVEFKYITLLVLGQLA